MQFLALLTRPFVVLLALSTDAVLRLMAQASSQTSDRA